MVSSSAPLSTATAAVIDSPESSRNISKTTAAAPAASTGSKRDYKGFVAGVFSGIAKLSGKSLRF
jgi:solute carrier family 25 carnitine/acylcarnitine transporter 20/29